MAALPAIVEGGGARHFLGGPPARRGRRRIGAAPARGVAAAGALTVVVLLRAPDGRPLLPELQAASPTAATIRTTRDDRRFGHDGILL